MNNFNDEFLKFIEISSELQEFLKNHPDADILYKKLEEDEIRRIIKEFPTLLKIREDEIDSNMSIYSITLISPSFSSNGYAKIKAYFKKEQNFGDNRLDAVDTGLKLIRVLST